MNDVTYLSSLVGTFTLMLIDEKIANPLRTHNYSSSNTPNNKLGAMLCSAKENITRGSRN